MFTISWFTLGVIVVGLLVGIGISSYLVNYLDCFKKVLTGIYQNFKFEYVVKWMPEKSLMLALDYFISTYYGNSPTFKAATVFQTVQMIIAAYLPDKNISAKELQEITDYLLNRKFKVGKMFELDELDIPSTEKELVDKIVPLVKDITENKLNYIDTLKNKPLSVLKSVLRNEVPEVDYYQKDRLEKINKQFKIKL